MIFFGIGSIYNKLLGRNSWSDWRLRLTNCWNGTCLQDASRLESNGQSWKPWDWKILIIVNLKPGSIFKP